MIFRLPWYVIACPIRYFSAVNFFAWIRATAPPQLAFGRIRRASTKAAFCTARQEESHASF